MIILHDTLLSATASRGLMTLSEEELLRDGRQSESEGPRTVWITCGVRSLTIAARGGVGGVVFRILLQQRRSLKSTSSYRVSHRQRSEKPEQV